jgi:hypothetical protein
MYQGVRIPQTGAQTGGVWLSIHHTRAGRFNEKMVKRPKCGQVSHAPVPSLMTVVNCQALQPHRRGTAEASLQPTSSDEADSEPKRTGEGPSGPSFLRLGADLHARSKPLAVII